MVTPRLNTIRSVAREVSTDLEMLERLVAPTGRDVLDIGCGGGALARELAARGARVTGVEISEQQLVDARAAEPGQAVRYLVGQAQQLPLEDETVDLAVFMRALHHVPADLLPAALREARRVLRSGGAVYVAEPLATGDYFELMSLVEDERAVRRAAQAALDRAQLAGLDRAETVEYDVVVRVAGFHELRRRFVSVDPRRAAGFDARADALAAAWARHGDGAAPEATRCFTQPMRADVLRVIS